MSGGHRRRDRVKSDEKPGEVALAALEFLVRPPLR